MEVAEDGNTHTNTHTQTSINALRMFWHRTEESSLTIATLLTN